MLLALHSAACAAVTREASPWRHPALCPSLRETQPGLSRIFIWTPICYLWRTGTTHHHYQCRTFERVYGWLFTLRLARQYEKMNEKDIYKAAHRLRRHFVLYRKPKYTPLKSQAKVLSLSTPPAQPSSSSSLNFVARCKSPSAFSGNHLTLTFNIKPKKAKNIHPKCPSNQPPLIPTAYKLAIPTGATARIPLLTVKAIAFSVASVFGLGATSFKQSCTHTNDIAMPEPSTTVVKPSVQNAASKWARSSSFRSG